MRPGNQQDVVLEDLPPHHAQAAYSDRELLQKDDDKNFAKAYTFDSNKKD